jgi:hypothetical protein
MTLSSSGPASKAGIRIIHCIFNQIRS